MEYWVYENWRRKKAVVHFANCGACKYGRGMHDFNSSGKNCRWLGSYSTLEEAIVVAKQTMQPYRLCGLCDPY